MVWLLCLGQGLTVQQFAKFGMGRSCKFYLAAINLSGKGCGLAAGIGCSDGKGFNGGCPSSQER